VNGYDPLNPANPDPFALVVNIVIWVIVIGLAWFALKGDE